MSELFKPEMVAGDSPRLKWIKRHQLKTERAFDEYYDEMRWCAWRDLATCFDSEGSGITEDDAIADWARRNGVKLWNEE